MWVAKITLRRGVKWQSTPRSVPAKRNVTLNLIAPDIDAGSIMYKELTFMSAAQVAGIVMGAKVPVILTSRSDSAEARMFSAALAVRVADATAKDPTLLHPATSE